MATVHVGPSQKQCVWIVRYGLTEFPLVEGVGPFDSDIDPTEGVEHAKCIAKRIAACADNAPRVVFSSPFLRTAHTAHIVASEVSPTAPVNIESGLTEWLTPSLLVEPNGVKTEPRAVSELARMFSSIDPQYESVNPVLPDECPIVPTGAPRFIESEDALLVRCATTLTRLIDKVQGNSICIVSHAPCDQAIALHLEGALTLRQSTLGPWPLGGVTMFSRVGCQDGQFGPWTIEMYGDTNHMPGVYTRGIKEWSLPGLAISQRATS